MLSARLLVNAATLVIALGTGSIAKADIATDWNAIAIEATAVPARIARRRSAGVRHPSRGLLGPELLRRKGRGGAGRDGLLIFYTGASPAPRAVVWSAAEA